jgi:hypothetical protein
VKARLGLLNLFSSLIIQVDLWSCGIYSPIFDFLPFWRFCWSLLEFLESEFVGWFGVDI